MKPQTTTIDDTFSGDAGIIFRIQQETFEKFIRRNSAYIIIEKDDGTYSLHRWTKESVFPCHDYEDKRKVVSRLLQLLEIGPVAPQTWPEETSIGVVNADAD